MKKLRRLREIISDWFEFDLEDIALWSLLILVVISLILAFVLSGGNVESTVGIDAMTGRPVILIH